MNGKTENAKFVIDKNLDKAYDDKDKAFKTDLRFGIITSNYSFSCANLMPSLAKDAGIMLIGERSGGGTCATNRYFTPDGLLYALSTGLKFVDKDGNTAFEPVGVYVCNHPWPYYGCVHGDGMARAFDEGDYFELEAVGVAADGSETSTSIKLIEFVNGELQALNDWTFFDLSSLGEVTSVYFKLNSTDTGNYGMNTAAYFCMDKFQVKRISTSLNSVDADKSVAGVRYVNLAGMTSDKPFDGVNVVVTTYSDGTISTAKVVK
jgi:hypothetical protein